jgi:hypothetical protein
MDSRQVATDGLDVDLEYRNKGWGIWQFRVLEGGKRIYFVRNIVDTSSVTEADAVL